MKENNLFELLHFFVYDQRYNLFDLRQKFILLEQIFICFKDTLFDSNNIYLI